MKLAITSVAAAVLLTGTFIANAQDADPGIAPAATPSTHHSSPNDRTRMKRRAERETRTDGYAEGSVGVRLPDHIKDCYEPIPPWCRRY
jgi:hypothetical protein